MNKAVLIVDDDSSILASLSQVLSGKYHVLQAGNGADAIKLFERKRPDVVLLDIGLPDVSGLEILKQMRQLDAEAMIIMVTAVDTHKTIVRAVKLGAYDYLVKPLDAEEVRVTVKNAALSKGLREKIELIQKPDVERYSGNLIGSSAKIKEIVETAGKVMKSGDTTLLIVGETGTGKSALAKWIHFNGSKVPGPFVTVNCGAIANELFESELFGYEKGAFTGARSEGKRGRFEEASGGSLLLDEIGVIPLPVQTKLLGVMEERAFYRVGATRANDLDTRIIAATNSDLQEAVRQGAFREDLYYRFNVVKVEIPPLRERLEDIRLLAEHFINEYNARFGKRFSRIEPAAMDYMQRYRWPGNVRELRNTIERIVLLEEGDTILPGHLSFTAEPVSTKVLPSTSLDYGERSRQLFAEALKKAGGNVQEASRLMNLPVHKVRYRIKKWGMKIPGQ